MNLERDFLARTAAETGFRGEMLEKVAHLLNLLRAIRENDFLRTRLALKGGTALNLFHFKMSRLSVDIDLRAGLRSAAHDFLKAAGTRARNVCNYPLILPKRGVPCRYQQ